ncbi:MAG: hypothetical protein RR630_06110 [Coprobacillus sp.]
MNKQEAVLKAHEMFAYEASEKSDQENNDFDSLWQSLYDVCKLAHFGVIDDLEDEEIQEALDWLKETKSLTKDYQEKDITF